MSTSARQEKTLGEIINLMAIDVDRFQNITPQIQNYWSSPLSVLSCSQILQHCSFLDHSCFDHSLSNNWFVGSWRSFSLHSLDSVQFSRNGQKQKMADTTNETKR